MPVDAGSIADPAPYCPMCVGRVQLLQRDGDSSTFASLRDRPDVPEAEILASEGDCTIFTHPEAGICDPPCEGFCVQTGDCIAWPTFTSAGTITVSGLTRPLEFVPSTWGYASQPAVPPVDLFEPGARVTASAPGDDAGGFALAVVAPPALETTTEDLVLEDGQDVEVRWTAEHVGIVELALLVGFHGAPYEAMLLCDAEDDGSLSIPAALVSALPRSSSSLEPHVSTITRLYRAVVQGPLGGVELVVGSQKIIGFSHP